MTEKKDNTKNLPPRETDNSSEPEALAKLETALTHFAQTFESSAKRWERMVYPAIVIFGILGISGFWLIYSLTSDVHQLASHVDPKMERNLHQAGHLIPPVVQHRRNESSHESHDCKYRVYES